MDIGCGILLDTGIKGLDLELIDIIMIDDNGSKIPFDYYQKEKNIQDGCDLPEHEELFLLNTKSYEPTGFRKTFKDIITLGGLYDNYPKVISEKFTENRVKMITKKLMDATNISHIQGTNILSIQVESLDYAEAKKILDIFIDSYVEQEKKWANIVTEAKIKFLENQISKKTIELNSIEDSIQSYQEIHKIYSEDGNANLLLENFLNLENQFNKEKIVYNDFKYRKQIFDFEIAKKDIPKSYELAIKDSIRNLTVSIESSNTRIDNIKKQLKDYQENLDLLPEKTKDFVRLRRDRMILDNSLILLEETLQSSKIAFESESGSAQIIVSPQFESQKDRPDVFTGLILSIFLGFVSICLILYLIEALNTTIKTVEDLEKYGLSVLSIIPSIGANKKRKQKITKIKKNK